MQKLFLFIVTAIVLLSACGEEKEHTKEAFDQCTITQTVLPGQVHFFDTTIQVKAGEEITLLMFKKPGTPMTSLVAQTTWDITYMGNWSGEMIGDEWEAAGTRFYVPDDVQEEQATVKISGIKYGADTVAVKRLYVERTEKKSGHMPAYIFYPVMHEMLFELTAAPAYFGADSLAMYLKSKAAKDFCEARKYDYDALVHKFQKLKKRNKFNVWDELLKRSASLKFLSQSTTYRAAEMDERSLTGIATQTILLPHDTLYIQALNKTGKPYDIEIWKTATDYRHKLVRTISQVNNPVTSISCNDLPKGFLMVRLKGINGETFDIPVIINKREHARIVVLAPVATWMAYNAYQGKSLYRNIHDKEPVYTASLDKPFTSVYFNPDYGSHDYIIVQNIFEWFDQYDGAMIFPDYYLQQHPDLLHQARTIVPAYHCEYFSVEMYHNLAALSESRNILAVGANQVYWRINWNDSRTFECRKDQTFFSNNRLVGGLWTTNFHSEASLLGGAYCGMVEAAPYKVLEPGHFLFEGCKVKKDDVFGKKGIDGLPISGDETDHINAFTPKNAVVVARGMNEHNLGGDMVYIERGAHGTLNTAAITSGSGLFADPVFTRIIENFMNKHHK